MKDITDNDIKEIAAANGVTVEQVKSILKTTGAKLYTKSFTTYNKDGSIDQVFLKDVKGAFFTDGYEYLIEDITAMIQNISRNHFYTFDRNELAEFDAEVYAEIDLTARV